jgi:hypothetical protein
LPPLTQDDLAVIVADHLQDGSNGGIAKLPGRIFACLPEYVPIRFTVTRQTARDVESLVGWYANPLPPRTPLPAALGC